MSDRDPRIDPMPGDEIEQRASRCRLRVDAVDGDQVTWSRKTAGGWVPETTWTLGGWRKVVAADSVVCHVARGE